MVWIFYMWFNTANSTTDETSFLEIKFWNRAKGVKYKSLLKLGYTIARL